MTDATQDPKRPHVWWYPQPERLIINAAKYATPDPRDARLAEMTTAMRQIRTLASDATWLAIMETDIFDAIHKLTADALAGAEPEPCAVVEAVAI